MAFVKGNKPGTWVKPVLGVGNKEKKEQMSNMHENTPCVGHLNVTYLRTSEEWACERACKSDLEWFQGWEEIKRG